ncbi:MAG: 30S ribosomal protein S9 [Spirochaetes bacterium]|nr:MAG: 30S ribosomal protein S9 [Spirochaetota bacterium]
MSDTWIFATGRRKTSVARVMVNSGTGKMTINGKKPEEYFKTINQLVLIREPLEVTDNLDKYDFKIRVRGGGLSGQAGAIRHGIARAIAEIDPDSRLALRKGGFLTRDARMVERKKPGKPKARKSFQFSKR